MSALRVVRNWDAVRRKRAAEAIQKYWKAALVEVEGPQGNRKRVHRSRVVPHAGKRLNARDINWWNEQWPNGSYMIPTNQSAVHERAKSRATWVTRAKKYRYLLQRQARAQAAWEKSPNAFAPFKRAGWVPHLVKTLARGRGEKEFVFVLKDRPRSILYELLERAHGELPPDRLTQYGNQTWSAVWFSHTAAPC